MLEALLSLFLLCILLYAGAAIIVYSFLTMVLLICLPFLMLGFAVYAIVKLFKLLKVLWDKD